LWTTENIKEVMLTNGTVVLFDEAGGHVEGTSPGEGSASSIAGMSREHQPLKIDLKNVLSVKVENSEFSAGRTIIVFGVLSTGVFITLFIIAISSIV
jgi:hypothetical protein